MLTVLFRILLTFNATSLLIVVYQVKSPFLFSFAEGAVNHILTWALVLIPVALTGFSLWVGQWLAKDSFKDGEIVAIDHANNSFLPSYLGYFFVALSVPNIETLAFAFLILFAFTFVSQALYFNPLFLILGFNFYSARTREGTSIFLISRAQYRRPADAVVAVAGRINGFTFLERG